MWRSAAGKVVWVGRTASAVFGLALVLALVFGLASAALSATGGKFILGKSNSANKTTSLTGAVANAAKAALVVKNKGPGPALDLKVGESSFAPTVKTVPPMRVDSQVKVEHLNADKVDGKHASDIGVNGLEKVTSTSASNSNSDKSATATCPAGKVVVGTGYDIAGAKSGNSPNRLTDVVVDKVDPINSTSVSVVAFEEDATSANWSVTAFAICATAP